MCNCPFFSGEQQTTPHPKINPFCGTDDFPSNCKIFQSCADASALDALVSAACCFVSLFVEVCAARMSVAPPLPIGGSANPGEVLTHATNRIIVGCHIYPLIPLDLNTVAVNPNQYPRRSSEQLFGVVMHATGKHKWMVHFNNGTQHECTSNTYHYRCLFLSPSHSFRPSIPHLPQQPGSSKERGTNSKKMRMSRRNQGRSGSERGRR